MWQRRKAKPEEEEEEEAFDNLSIVALHITSQSIE
jgi:hypothetical protein